MRDETGVVVDLVQDAVIADPDAVTLAAAQLACAGWTRIVSERTNGPGDALDRFLGEVAEIAGRA